MLETTDKVAEFGNRLLDLAQEVGGDAFPMLVHRARVGGLVGLITFGAIGILSLAILFWSLRRIVDSKEPEAAGLAAFLSTVIVLVCFVCAAVFTIEYLAPEGTAVKMILETCGGG